MNKKDFQSLLKGTKELGQMLRGEIPPAREFIYEVNTAKLENESGPVWAICISDKDDALIPLKMYEVRPFPDGNYVHVRDEEGEAFICPKDWFIFISLPKEVEDALKKVA